MHTYDNTDVYDMCCLELLFRQLYPRGVGKNAVFLEVGITTSLYIHMHILSLYFYADV